MPPSRTQDNNGQSRRSRRPGPLSQPPERNSRDESTQRQTEELSLEERIAQLERGHSSTPRGGRSGHGGQGSHSGKRGRSGPSSYRSSGAVSWNHPQPEAVPTYKHSPTAKMTQVCAEDGVVATKITPTGLGGGFGPNWYTQTPTGAWCHSSTGRGIDNVATKLMDEDPKATAIIATFTKVYDQSFEAISSRRTQILEMDNNFCGKDGKPVGLFGRDIHTPDQTKPVGLFDRDIQAPSVKKPVLEGECPLCGSRKHVLADCLERARKGFVHGCGICNSGKHYVDKCEQFLSMSLTEQVKILVSQRGNRPPLKTSKPWYMYLHEFCTSEEFVPGVVVGFPWSEKFCEDKGYNGLKKMQSAYDADPKNYVFETDPATSSWEMVHETYWRPAGKPWPKVLGSRIKVEDANERVIKTEPEV
ncbi:hypothetical protein FGADI_12491 [Fusarium gaditjirri]|uniref:Uncharacterized protein n=1 Tax=Fusarium gaditjirri TaxID=282569 RepID=A0A8H4WNY4_9HYPO|nr:hypothetical protein FGADI_12491 [Fusarium gaditjirri]